MSKIDTTTWLCTNPPKGKQRQMFPSRFINNLKRIYPYQNKKVLWMFSGAVGEEGDTIDIRPETGATFICSYEHIPVNDGTYDMVIADPPYNQLFSNEWKTDLPKPKHILKEAARITKSGGIIGILHCVVVPCYHKEGFGVQRIALHPILCGIHNAIRVFNVFEKE